MSFNSKSNKKESTSSNKKNNKKEKFLDNKKKINEEVLKDKINKPNELKYFDAISHFKQNIIRYDKNCSEPVKDLSYYCFSCKHSACNECGVYDHKEHLLIQRDNCINYDTSFFKEIEKVIEKGINFENEKYKIKKNISTSIKSIKDQLDLLEKEKLYEIDEIFNKIKDNYINLKDNYLKTKDCIENYYKTNQNFFNVKINETNQENSNGLNGVNILNDNIKNKKQLDNTKSYLYDNEIGPNKDIENTVFLMNFELMNLCDNKNLEIIEISNHIKNEITKISNIIEEKTKSLNEEIKNNYLVFDTEDITSKFDDFYWDVKIRCEKYNEHIAQFKDSLYEIFIRNGSYNKLRDLLSLFDSKNHKGKDVLFNQQFFIQMNDLSSLNPDNKNGKNYNCRSKSRKARNSSRCTSKNQSLKIQKNSEDKNMNNININKNNYPNNINNYNLNNKGFVRYNSKGSNGSIDSKKDLKRSHSNLCIKNSISNNISKISDNNFAVLDKENIILDKRILQRFFAYSILDFYSKYFKQNNSADDNDNGNNNVLDYHINNYFDNNKDDNNKDNDNKSLKKKDNNKGSKKNSKKKPYKNRKMNSDKISKLCSNSIDNNNIKSIKRNDNNDKNNIKNNKAFNTMEDNNNKNNNSNKSLILTRNNAYLKAVSLISSYSERYVNLKERVKPIIGTNYVQFFEPATNTINKVQVPLKKEKHGYVSFPEGCRHILINSELFVTGGTDNCGNPINIVLMLNIEVGEITRIGNLNDNHSYHSLEYLENFDSIILIGGENSSSCEIMDLDSKKWTRFPSLNYPRANVNIYYNNITSDLFVLFGMEGKMNEKVQNSDVIEVLELNDIISGWIKVEYYKTIGFDMRNSYCITLPFTKDKLIIYGGSTARSIEKRIFALFDMIKNEIIKVDSQTMELIKYEEKKIRSFDTTLQKFDQY